MRFSNRTSWPTEENSLTLAVRERRRSGAEILDLTPSNPTSVGLDYPEDLLTSLRRPEGLEYAPEALGHPRARACIAARYGVDPTQVVITASTSEAYATLFQVLADPGDEVLIPAPSYPLLGYLADLTGVALVPYPLRYDGAWHVDLPALRAAVTGRTRAIVVVSPNNPTGSFLKRDELVAMQATGLPIIADEVFSSFPLGPSDPRRVTTVAHEQGGLLFALSGLSKTCGLPQLKLGWMIVAGEGEARRAALSRLELVCDTFLSVGTPVQLALPDLLVHGDGIAEQIRHRTRENLQVVQDTLTPPSAASVLAVEGGWVATLRVPATRTEVQWVRALLDEGVLVHPGHFFDFASEAYLVLSLLTPPPIFRAGVLRLGTLVEREVRSPTE